MNNTPKQVGIWLRVSTEDQVRGESLEIHEHRARSYAESKGWSIIETYSLGAVSGKKVIDHPEARRMIADIRSGHITSLIFSKLARLSRNNRELLEFADIFQKAGADLVSLAESIDTGTPAGRMFYNMLSAMANWEREEIQSRVQASVPIRAALGKSLGGATPYGYVSKDKQLVPDQCEAPIRVLMYQLYSQHKRRRTVARLLNDMGHRTRNGSMWSDTSVERNLRDTTSIGKRRINYTRTADERTGRVEHKPESEWVWVDVPAIIPQQLYDECISHMDEQRLSGTRLTRKSVNLFSGFAKCATCQGKLIVPSGIQKYVCRPCNIRIPMDILEEAFVLELRDIGISEDSEEEHKRLALAKLSDLHSLIAAQQALITSVERDIDVLIELYSKKLLDEAGFKERHDKHQARKVSLQEELPKLIAREKGTKASLTSRSEAYKESQDILQRWPSLTRENKRLLIEAVLDDVFVSTDSVVFDFCFTPPPTPFYEATAETESIKATNPQGFIAAIN